MCQEMIELKISERSVPIDTIVNPIMRGETPNAFAKSEECLMALSLEIVINKIPTTKPNIAKIAALIL